MSTELKFQETEQPSSRTRRLVLMIVGAAIGLCLAVVGSTSALVGIASSVPPTEPLPFGTTTDCDGEADPAACQQRLREAVGEWAGFTPSRDMTVVSTGDTANLDPIHSATIVIPAERPSPISALEHLYGAMEPFPADSGMVRIFAADGLLGPTRASNVSDGVSYYASQGTQRDGTIVLRLRVSY